MHERTEQTIVTIRHAAGDDQYVARITPGAMVEVSLVTPETSVTNSVPFASFRSVAEFMGVLAADPAFDMPVPDAPVVEPEPEPVPESEPTEEEANRG